MGWGERKDGGSKKATRQGTPSLSHNSEHRPGQGLVGPVRDLLWAISGGRTHILRAESLLLDLGSEPEPSKLYSVPALNEPIRQRN